MIDAQSTNRLRFLIGAGREILGFVRFPGHLDIGLPREIDHGVDTGFFAELLQGLFRDSDRAVTETRGGGDDEDAFGVCGDRGEEGSRRESGSEEEAEHHKG